MGGRYIEKFHVNQFWELKGQVQFQGGPVERQWI